MVKKMLIVIAVFIIAIILSMFLALRIPSLDLSGSSSQSKKLETIGSWLTKLNQSGKFNGAVLLAKRGDTVFESYYGLNGGSGLEKINSHSSFNLASVSKQFTAMGIVLLNSKSSLEYDDEISKYIPEFEFYEEVTIRNLLHHTSGIPDYMRLVIKHRVSEDPLTVSELIDLYIKEKPKLNFNPGEKFEYSNTGYVLLSEIIERASNQNFYEFMAENIFMPLGMIDTQVFNLLSENHPKNRVYGYGHKYWLYGGKKQSKDLNYFDGVAGDGGVYSSATDLALWHKSLHEGKLVSKEQYEIAYQPAELLDGSRTKYGFGWFLNADNTVEHAGGWQGFTSFIYRDLKNGDLVVILDNSSNTLRVNSIGYRFNSIGLNLKHAIKEL